LTRRSYTEFNFISIGQEAKQKGLNKLTMRQIDAEIGASRRERQKQST
jgi:hypothetical protein